VLKKEAEEFEDHTRDLATAADRILRKHGKRIADMQFATRRLADIMIDLFLMACVLSRVDGSVRRLGEEGAARELEILRVFAGQVERRVKSNYGKIDDNDDELIKSLADHAFAEERFSWDNLPG
jgi:acyl-CoA dehydrogenase family member 9